MSHERRHLLGLPGIALSLALPSCVSTDVAPSAASLPCIADGSAPSPAETLVLIGFVEGGASEACPGVVISPSLVITSASCLMPSVGARLFADQAPNCDGETGWPLEQGDFTAWIGRSDDIDRIRVYVANGTDTAPLDVLAVYTSGATSRCANDLGMVHVASGLPPSRARIRFHESTIAGEEVTLSGLHFVEGYVTPNEAPASVTELTYEAGDSELPPRSLLLNGQVCLLAHGGGVFSAETRALLGIIAWGSRACDDAEGTTVAIRLAPFRRFLLEVGSAMFSETLQAEIGFLDGQSLSPCPR
jgi:hypothetical protein